MGLEIGVVRCLRRGNANNEFGSQQDFLLGIDDLGADSLDLAELVMEFEDEFDLNIPESEKDSSSGVERCIGDVNEQLGFSDGDVLANVIADTRKRKGDLSLQWNRGYTEQSEE